MAAQNRHQTNISMLVVIAPLMLATLIILSAYWFISELRAGWTTDAIEPLIVMLSLGGAAIAYGIAYYQDKREEALWKETFADVKIEEILIPPAIQVNSDSLVVSLSYDEKEQLREVIEKIAIALK
jgi:hypothetical protein